MRYRIFHDSVALFPELVLGPWGYKLKNQSFHKMMSIIISYHNDAEYYQLENFILHLTSFCVKLQNQ